MIDPKFNQLPATAEGDFAAGAEQAAEGIAASGPKKPRPGLSINDTVAANANLSVGARGVDTSGASAGSGAGAGMTLTTPGNDGSPAPTIAPGPRGSGTTPRGDSVSSQIPTTRLEAGTEGLETYGFTVEEISHRAYHCWRDRGCPQGSPEVDWQTAVNQLREKREREAKNAANA